MIALFPKKSSRTQFARLPGENFPEKIPRFESLNRRIVLAEAEARPPAPSLRRGAQRPRVRGEGQQTLLSP